MAIYIYASNVLIHLSHCKSANLNLNLINLNSSAIASFRQEMAIAPPRIQPVSAHLHSSASPKDSDHQEKKQVCYTVWMKSLVFNGRGCTVYGQDGRAAYRVDNYACRRSREVFVMDSGGKTLLKLLKKVH